MSAFSVAWTIPSQRDDDDDSSSGGGSLSSSSFLAYYSCKQYARRAHIFPAKYFPTGLSLAATASVFFSHAVLARYREKERWVEEASRRITRILHGRLSAGFEQTGTRRRRKRRRRASFPLEKLSLETTRNSSRQAYNRFSDATKTRCEMIVGGGETL